VSEKAVEKIETHILCSIIFFSETRALYEIRWKNVAEWDRPQITIWRMRIACWVRKATNTYSEYVTLAAFLLQQWMRYVTLHMHYLSCLIYCQHRHSHHTTR